jgi:hypothetical protein
VVPFGLSNAPAVFMCLMNGVFREYLDKFIIVFLDEILIYSKSEEEHEHHLKMVLQVLREHQLYAKLRKCSFYHKQIHYLEHIVLEYGITVVKSQYFWPGMKREIAEYIARCMECQKVKTEHRHPAGLLQPLPILEWKWEVVTMDFIMGLPRTCKIHDSIMVVVEKITKDAHFIPLKTTHKVADVADIFMKEVARLHEIPKTIVSDKDLKFTSNFWKGLFKGFRMNLNFSTAYHPESDGQTKRVNRVIEDMLRMYVMDKPSKWEDYLHLVEFAYNNGYQASLKMIPFEALYDRRSNTLVVRPIL